MGLRLMCEETGVWAAMNTLDGCPTCNESSSFGSLTLRPIDDELLESQAGNTQTATV